MSKKFTDRVRKSINEGVRRASLGDAKTAEQKAKEKELQRQHTAEKRAFHSPKVEQRAEEFFTVGVEDEMAEVRWLAPALRRGWCNCATFHPALPCPPYASRHDLLS